ncbi:hypothetical protein A1D31_35935 [Bradyrhizobium liaoningense]|nr:hypothetical protein A1D31_35935 [Bradyrhizobium liaoningense]
MTLAVTGFEFFTVTTPKLFASTSRYVMLAGTFRPLLVRNVLEKDLGYLDQCIANDRVVDLDSDGWSSDLIVTIYAKQKVGGRIVCSEEFDETSAIHLILKEVPWTGWRPRYSLLHAFAMGIPTTIDTLGPFVIATTAARVNPGYHIFAYSNAALQSFGSFRSLADEEPKLQMGRHLFMRTIDEFVRFEILPSGEARTEVMTGIDIVTRNNTAIIVEDKRRWSDQVRDAAGSPRPPTNWVDFGDYQSPSGSDPECSEYAVYQNGYPLTFKKSVNGKALCSAELQVAPVNQVVINLVCSYEGVIQSPQFPWGWLIDQKKPKHVVRCPNDDDYQEKAEYEINLVLRDG